MLRRIAGTSLVVSLAACATWDPVTVPPAQYLAQQHPSSVRVTLADGSHLTILDPAVSADSLAGRATPGPNPNAPARQVRVPVDQVSQLCISHIDAGRTLLLVTISVLAIASAIETSNSLGALGGGGY